jgi:hypothetical protein
LKLRALVGGVRRVHADVELVGALVHGGFEARVLLRVGRGVWAALRLAVRDRARKDEQRHEAHDEVHDALRPLYDDLSTNLRQKKLSSELRTQLKRWAIRTSAS